MITKIKPCSYYKEKKNFINYSITINLNNIIWYILLIGHKLVPKYNKLINIKDRYTKYIFLLSRILV